MLKDPLAALMILIEFAAAPASIAAGLYIWARRNGSSLARAFAILFVTLGLAFLFDSRFHSL